MQGEIKERIEGFRDVVIIAYAWLGMLDMPDGMAEESARIEGGLRESGAVSFQYLHEHPDDAKDVLERASAVWFAGGNNWALLNAIHAERNFDGTLVDQREGLPEESIVDDLRLLVNRGKLFGGTSAGANVAQRVALTNDMAGMGAVGADGRITQRFDGLGLLPDDVGLNVHYPASSQNQDGGIEGRDERLSQVDQMGRHQVGGRKIIALRNGAALTVVGNTARLIGPGGGVLFQDGQRQEVVNGADLSHLLVGSPS